MKQFTLFIILSLAICSCKVYQQKDIRNYTKTKPPIDLFDTSRTIPIEQVIIQNNIDFENSKYFDFIEVKIEYPNRLTKDQVNQELRKLAASLGVSLITNVSSRLSISNESSSTPDYEPISSPSGLGTGTPTIRANKPPPTIIKNILIYSTIIEAVFLRIKE